MKEEEEEVQTHDCVRAMDKVQKEGRDASDIEIIKIYNLALYVDEKKCMFKVR